MILKRLFSSSPEWAPGMTALEQTIAQIPAHSDLDWVDIVALIELISLPEGIFCLPIWDGENDEWSIQFLSRY